MEARCRAQEKLSKMQSTTATLALDRSYILFAVNKKLVQEGASESLGKVEPPPRPPLTGPPRCRWHGVEGVKQLLTRPPRWQGNISAVNLMEFDQRMSVAHKSHRECIVTIKAFWKYVAKKPRKSKPQNALDRVLPNPRVSLRFVSFV